jgi:hypothetical protein
MTRPVANGLTHDDVAAVQNILDREPTWLQFLNSPPHIRPGSTLFEDDTRSEYANQSPDSADRNLVSETAHGAVVAAGGACLGLHTLALALVDGSRPLAGNTVGPAIRSTLLPAMRALWILGPDARSVRQHRAAHARAKELEDTLTSLKGLGELGRAGMGDDLQSFGRFEQRTKENLTIMQRLIGGGRACGETRVVREAAEGLRQSGPLQGESWGVIPDMMQRAWTVYSGDAHGWHWQVGHKGRILEPIHFAPGRQQVAWEPDPGLLLADVVTVSTLAFYALLRWQARATTNETGDIAGT